MLKIGIMQLEADESVARNLERAARAADCARKLGCAALCLPECSLTGYCPDEAARRAISATDPALDALADAARERGVDIIAGFMERAGERLYITQGLFRADGARDFYRKTHLGERERARFSPGDRLRVFELTGGLKAGVMLCVEARFPEIAQALSLRGAQVLFAPHASPMSAERRRALWRIILPARACDNRAYVAACNQCDGARYGGGLMALGPNGAEVAAPQAGEAIAAFDVDEAELARYRRSRELSHRYYPALRRPELY